MNRRPICSRFDPRFLIDEQKQMSLSWSRDFIETADSNPNVFKTVLMGDEMVWCFVYNPQTKRQSSVWLSSGA